MFDTQLAAGFIGFGNQEGYESLVRKVLDVKLKGAEGFTKWDRRPLTPQQLEYAGDDARLLLALGEQVERRLDERGRLEWAREECRALEESSDERDPDARVRAPAAARPAQPAARGGGARAGRVARGRGPRNGPPARLRAARPGADRGGPARAWRPRGPRADPRPAGADAAPARRRAAGGDRPRARAQRAARPARARPPATPPTPRSCRSPRRSCATARWRRAWRWS